MRHLPQTITGVLTLSLTSAALAGTPPDDGHDWVTIGAPGNRATLPEEVPMRPFLQIGAVGYEYRLTRTEITADQWLGFVQAYAPYWTGSPSDPNFTSWSIYPTPTGYRVSPGQERFPVEMSWQVAARYCNWLHNDRAPEQAAFESGAYDTSTFTVNPDGTANDQATHSPGARYWIPTRDEWVKGAYYDPDRHGPGQEGYWLSAGSHEDEDVWLVSGLPEAGGETNGGLGVPPGLGMDAGSYPHVPGPWGLLDISGGTTEWTEDLVDTAGHRRVLGSWYRSSGYGIDDRIDNNGFATDPRAIPEGFRLASAVPGPAGGVVMIFAMMTLFSRRQR